MIEGHGDDLHLFPGSIRSNFSSNIYQHADLSALQVHLASRLNLIANYPEPRPYSLEQLLAEQLQLMPDQVMVTNGATEAIYLAAQLQKGSTSLIPQPTFSEYADACRLFGHHIVTEHPAPDVCWLCNPNNPTGQVVPKDQLLHRIRHEQHCLFVIDQSYEHYTDQPLLTAAEAATHPNLLLLHSMTKQYCIPGLRLGYVTGAASLLQRLRTLCHPWSVNALAVEAGKFLLRSGAPSAVPPLKPYLAEAQRLRTLLNQMEGIRVAKTQTNFMLAHITPVTATDLKHHLIDHHGMLIRDGSNFPTLDHHYFRVSAQSPEEDDTLIRAIHQYLCL